MPEGLFQVILICSSSAESKTRCSELSEWAAVVSKIDDTIVVKFQSYKVVLVLAIVRFNVRISLKRGFKRNDGPKTMKGNYI